MKGLCPCADQEGVEERVELKQLMGVPFAREVGEEGVLPAAPHSFPVHHLRPPREAGQLSRQRRRFLTEGWLWLCCSGCLSTLLWVLVKGALPVQGTGLHTSLCRPGTT